MQEKLPTGIITDDYDDDDAKSFNFVEQYLS